MPLQMLINKYADRLVLDFDSSKLVDTQVEKGIEEIRSNKEGGSTVKEMGMSMLLSKLKEEKLDSDIRVSEIFNILSADCKEGEGPRESAMEAARIGSSINLAVARPLHSPA